MRVSIILSLASLVGAVTAAVLPPSAIDASLESREPLDKRLLLPQPPAGFSDPGTDPFYKPPDNIGSYKKGTVIRRRDTKSTFALLPANNVAKSYQIGVASENRLNQSILAVATVLVPKNPKKDIGILSFQGFEDAVSVSCAPSWAYVANSGSPAALAGNVESPFWIGWAMDNGYYAVIPDHEGPTAAFISGPNAGKIILDSIRGIISSEQLPADSRVGLGGYSGGGHATVWGTVMQESYAPELNIVGAAHGGTPIDPEHIINYISGGFWSGFALAGVTGLMTQHPALNDYVYSIITPDGRKKLEKITSPGQCIQNVIFDYAFTDVFSLVTKKNPLSAAAAQETLKENTLLKSKASFKIPVPKYPRLVYHSPFDEVIPYNDTVQFVKDQCAEGANIAFATLPLAEHALGQLEGTLPAIAFVGKALAGTTPSVECGSIKPAEKLDPVKILGPVNGARFALLQANPDIVKAVDGFSKGADGKPVDPSSVTAKATAFFKTLFGL